MNNAIIIFLWLWLMFRLDHIYDEIEKLKSQQNPVNEHCLAALDVCNAKHEGVEK